MAHNRKPRFVLFFDLFDYTGIFVHVQDLVPWPRIEHRPPWVGSIKLWPLDHEGSSQEATSVLDFQGTPLSPSLPPPPYPECPPWCGPCQNQVHAACVHPSWNQGRKWRGRMRCFPQSCSLLGMQCLSHGALWLSFCALCQGWMTRTPAAACTLKLCSRPNPQSCYPGCQRRGRRSWGRCDSGGLRQVRMPFQLICFHESDVEPSCALRECRRIHTPPSLLSCPLSSAEKLPGGFS